MSVPMAESRLGRAVSFGWSSELPGTSMSVASPSDT